MRTSVVRIGNSRGIRVPKVLLDQARSPTRLNCTPSLDGLSSKRRADRAPVGSRAGAVPQRPVSSPRPIERRERISRTPLSCRLHIKGYETYRTGRAFTGGPHVTR